jgi:hypothetical protein
MRFVFLLILLAGAAIGVGYPWYVSNFSGKEIGTWRAYDRATGFRPFEARLTEADAPVRALVDLTTLGAPTFDETRTVLTVTAAGGGRTVLADTLTFSNAVRREVSPQATEKIYRADAGVIHAVTPGTYTFTLGQGDADGIDMRSVDVVLRSDAALLDPRAQPLGFTLMAVGFIGLVAASRRRRRDDAPANPNSQPPPPRWGRDAGRR